MARKNGRQRSLEEAARREKIRELLALSGVEGMEDIQQLFCDTIAEFLESGLAAAMDEQLCYDRYDVKGKETNDSRNGHSKKTLRTSFGDTTIQIPRDRKGEFDPAILRKNQTSISQEVEAKIISMYAKGMRTTDIADHIRDIYGIEVSESTVGRITGCCPKPGNGSRDRWKVSMRSCSWMRSIITSAAKGRS